jgi:hypothetical protein
VDESWCCGVSEVQAGQVKEIDDKEKFGGPEMPTNPEHDETEGQEVVLDSSAMSLHNIGARTNEDEMGSDVSSAGHELLVGRVQM